MWIRTQNKDKFINLDNVDSIEITPINSVICRIGDKGHVLGTYNSFDNAEQVVEGLLPFIEEV